MKSLIVTKLSIRTQFRSQTVKESRWKDMFNLQAQMLDVLTYLQDVQKNASTNSQIMAPSDLH